MIKSQHSLAKLDAMAKTFFKEVDAEFNLTTRLAAWPNDELKPVMVFLHQNLKKVITGRPDVLEQLAVNILPLLNQAKVDYRVNHPVIMVGTTVLTDQKKN